MEIKNEKCFTCIGKYEYKTAIPCRYCKWNTEPYWGRREERMVEDHYRYAKSLEDADDNIPF